MLLAGDLAVVFTDRHDAGRRLAERLTGYRDKNPIVLGLPRGGVVVAYEVARALEAPLDVIVTRKLGAPYNPEFGFGAVGPDGVRVIDEGTVRMLGLSQEQIERIAAAESQELERRLRRYRGQRPMPDLRHHTAIVVEAVRQLQATSVVLAVPVSPPDTAESLRAEVDELVCLQTPLAFMAVGQWYEDFGQTSDAEVVELLERSARERAP